MLTNDVILRNAADAESILIGTYGRFRGLLAPAIWAGDFTPDLLLHNGTFALYNELGTKQITSSNGAAEALWASIFDTAYNANFLINNLPSIQMDENRKNEIIATARFLRGYAFFIGAYTFGKLPITTTTDITANRTITRSNVVDVLAFVLDDLEFAEENLPTTVNSSALASTWAAKAALARFHLYAGNWAEAESFATEVIQSGLFPLEDEYEDAVGMDFPSESIFEADYSANDDPRTSTTRGLFNIFLARREAIPSNEAVVLLNADESGDRVNSISFDAGDVGPADNGWTVIKYEDQNSGNNNIPVFRTAEMYLILAEACAQQGRLSPANDPDDLQNAEEVLNVLRNRADALTFSATGLTQSEVLEAIERERVYELAYEGHRWFDLKRTNRITTVMNAFAASNGYTWSSTFELWPVPLTELQTNSSLAADQNPGY
ncbi:MAG: RagB/SusD family nutrient uptake outer membrane protein [Microscillaceae bacterium]